MYMYLAFLNYLLLCFQTLKPGGSLLFRDYGQYDYAMLRFAPGHKLADNFYVRQDGTRAFYFSLGEFYPIHILTFPCHYIIPRRLFCV